jgi:hypothetical protein
LLVFQMMFMKKRFISQISNFRCLHDNAAPFIGNWMLRIDHTYTHVVPSLKVSKEIYRMSLDEGQISFSIESSFPDGRKITNKYQGILGKDVPFPNQNIVDFMRTFSEPRVLRSEAWKNGEIVANTIRQLNPHDDNIMTINVYLGKVDESSASIHCVYDRIPEISPPKS